MSIQIFVSNEEMDDIYDYEALLNYFYVQKITCLFFIPIILMYILLLCYILHVTSNNSPMKGFINYHISERKKHLIIFLIFTYFYQIIFQLYYAQLSNTETSMFPIIFSGLSIVSLVLTIYLIDERNKKNILLSFKNPIFKYLIFNDLYYFIDILNEIINGIFFDIYTFLPLSFLMGVYLTYLYFRYPHNKYISLLSSNISFPEIDTLREKLRNNRTQDKKKVYIEMNYFSETFKRKSSKYSLNSINNENDIPKINIKFKNSFYIQFKEEKIERNQMKNVADCYENIFFDIDVMILTSNNYLKTVIKKNLLDFVKLDEDIHKEFVPNSYNNDLIDKLPFFHIEFDPSYNQMIIIKKLKNSAETYLKEILKEPAFINYDVLLFLEINNREFENIFDKIREKYTITDDTKINMVNLLTSKIKRSISFSNKRIIVQILIGSYHDKDILFEKKKLDSNGNKIYYLTIRLICDNSYKIVQKKMYDTIFFLDEYSKLYQNELKNKKKKDFKSNSIEYYLLSFLEMKNKYDEKSKYPSYHLFKYKNNEKNIYEYIQVVENLLQYIIDNYSTLQNLNNNLREYFDDFKDDFWNGRSHKNINTHYTLSSKTLGLVFDSNTLEILLQENRVSNISIILDNYILITVNYKTNVFYEICFTITSTSSDFIKVCKKYKFKEIRKYIDLMSNKLKIVQYWPDECFIGNPEAKFLKYKNRMYYISTYLKSILKCKQYFNIPQWKEIFKYDIAFSSIQNSKDRNSDDSNSSNTKNSNCKEDSAYQNLIS